MNMKFEVSCKDMTVQGAKVSVKRKINANAFEAAVGLLYCCDSICEELPPDKARAFRRLIAECIIADAED